MAAIKIISTPPGEAPQEIRDAWIGLVLPLAVPSARRAVVTWGVVTGPKTHWKRQWCLMLGKGRRLLLGKAQDKIGYVVNANAAVMLLERVNPIAAGWWKQNAAHMLLPGHIFMFAVEACEEVEDIVWPPPPNPHFESQSSLD